MTTEQKHGKKNDENFTKYVTDTQDMVKRSIISIYGVKTVFKII